MSKWNNYLFGLLGFCAIFLTASCYERQEGCLDALSTNFDINADDECDDCCTYPTMSLQVSHFLGAVRYNFDSIVVTDLGQELKLNQSLIFLSNFQYLTTDNGILEVLETSLYEDQNGQEIEWKEDHLLLTESTGSTNIGTIRETGVIDQFQFDLGIAHNLVSIDETQLLFQADSLYTNDYFDVVFYLKTGFDFEDDKVVRFRVKNDNNTKLFDVVDFEKPERTNVIIPLRIDYLETLKTLDILNLDDEHVFLDYEFPSTFIQL